MENKKQRIELADIFSSRAKDFLLNNKLCPDQLKAFNAIMKCRTAELGGHIECCDSCGHKRQSYNSCRNRHCPKCQFVKKALWVDKLASNLPPVKYFHVVFTIPNCLHKLFYINQKKAYSLFLNAAGKALMQCASNTNFLGVQAGSVALLHTWGQTLVYHPHVHMIVPAGGLSEDLTEWIPAKKKFFIPVKALSSVFRGILCRLLEEAVENIDIKLPDKILYFKTIKEQCYKKQWVVYCKKPFSCSDNLINYLGNYTHRVAISNNRILDYQDGKVSFCYKDYKEAGLKKRISVDADEFIRRFIQHVLPKGFYKIRYFGFMAMCNIKSKLALCFDLIEKVSFLPVLQGLNALEVWRIITGIDPLCCPKCKTGKMKLQTVSIANDLKSG